MFNYFVLVGAVVTHDGVQKLVVNKTDEAEVYGASSCYGSGSVILEFDDGTEALEKEFLEPTSTNEDSEESSDLDLFL